MESGGKVAIVGSGLVGKSWAMIFASAGFRVCLFDVEASQTEKAIKDIKSQLESFEKDGVLRGDLTAAQQIELISANTDLKECLKDVFYIQECVPESLDLKLKVWGNVEKILLEINGDLKSESAPILASSTSCIVPSKISDSLTFRDNFMVAHPVNPPYLAPMVELVPAPWTRDSVKADIRKLMFKVGQVPVSLSRELPGFILNRIQYAILNECWRLLADEVVSSNDLDVVMRDGLGLRYAFMGPMETIHLNAEGTRNYIDRYGHTIYNVSQDSGPIPEAWKLETPEAKNELEIVASQAEADYPLDKLDERRQRRDICLAALAKLKKTLPK